MFKNKNKEVSNSFKREDAKKKLGNDSPFVVKEAYNSIRTNLLFTQKGEKCPVFVVTSPTANNGKTINSVNLAISYAQMGKKTLIIDSDMRNPTIHRMFNIPLKDGLSEILAGITDSISVTSTNIENLSVLPAGQIPPNPAELLGSNRMNKLLDFVREHFDCVFIDSPPINIVTDATIFASNVTGYILIIKSGVTDKEDVKYSVSILEQVNAKILGCILNDVPLKEGKYYSKYKNYSNYK